MGVKYDFSGWATRNDLKCSDGRTIRKDAFKQCDGMTVPLVWNHQHNEPTNVLGHALLENREDGVYTYCTCNDTELGRTANELVKHGDIVSLSIYANQLKQNGGDVLHGQIREVSLVLAGANPGAYIDTIISHSDDADEEAIIYTGEEFGLDLEHADSEPEDKKEDKPMAEEAKKEKTIGEVVESMTEEQKTALYALVGMAVEDAKGGKKEKSEEDGGSTVKHNVFENDNPENTLSHSDMEAIFNDVKRYGSLKDSVLAHGIEDIEYLFPDATNLDKTPQFIDRDQGWVSSVMNGVSHSPFSRIKSMYADITEDDARALGYLPDRTHRDAKGNLVDANGNPAYKKEEVFSLLKRTTTPATVYKKQKLDRDDVIDITDFDVVAWIKTEMRGKLNEELARAFLIGDGRLSSSDDKINEQNIRPILTDSAFYTIKTTITTPTTVTADDKAKEIIRAAVKSRSKYKGSGNTTFYTTEDYLTDMLLLEDKMGHRLYNTEAELAAAMRVSKIVTVPVMENYKNSAGESVDLIGIIVNLTDYTVGADKGGAVNMFDDFDIDYNAQKYLIETRCSGALTKPWSAIAMTAVTSAEATECSHTIVTANTI